MSPARPEGISVVIRAYNEEQRIGDAIASYLPVLESTGLPFEIIVVVDGDDHTQEAAATEDIRGHPAQGSGGGDAPFRNMGSAGFEPAIFAV